MEKSKDSIHYINAFDKLFGYCVPKDLLSWCVYSNSLNDKAHDLKHVYSVCVTAMELLRYYQPVYGITPRQEQLVMIACLLHDIGCRYDRKFHHLIGYGLTYEYLNRYCPKMFTEEELAIVANCVLEHRSSSLHPPRGILSEIVNIADSGCPNIHTYIRRAILFRIDSKLSETQMINEVCKHLHEKFGRQEGYHWRSYPKIGFDYYLEEWNTFINYIENNDILIPLIQTSYRTICDEYGILS